MSTESRTPRDAGLRPEFVLDVWRRRKWLALVVFLAAYAGAVTIAKTLPNLYQASATVLVEQQAVSAEFVRPSVTSELETRIQTIHQRVMSRERLADMITRLNLYPELRSFAPIEAVVGVLRGDIIPLQLRGVNQASGVPATIAFTIGFRGRDPETVARVTNALAGVFVEENAHARERQAAGTVEFLAAQLEDAKLELDGHERRTSEFTLRHTDELPQQLEANLAALDRLNTQLRLNGEYQLRALERRERLEEGLTAAPAVPLAPGAAAPPDPAAELRRLNQQLGELRRRFSDQYPDVRRVTTEIAAMEQQIVARGAESSEPAATDATATIRRTIAGLDAEIAALRQQDALLRRAIADYESRVERAPRRQYEVEQLSRGYDMVKARYEGLLQRYQDAQLAARLEEGQSTEHFRVLDPAIPPAQPSAPNRQWLMMMGFFAALGLAFGAVFAAERFDTTFHTADDLRAFIDLPAVVTIRRIATRAETRRRRYRWALMTASAIAGLALVIAASHYVASGNVQLVRLTTRGAM
jgi:succinoglycan biosynthesis transport protein ExoP